MKDDQLKKLMQNSKMTTSADFTARLLDKIEMGQNLEVQTPWSLKNVLVAVLSISFVLGFLLLKVTGHVSNAVELGTVLNSKFLFIGFLIVALLGLNHVLKLGHLSKNLVN